MQGLLKFAEPESDWTPPEVLPDLSGAEYICVDCETKDPYLTSRGPGEIRRDGFICGVALSTDIGHEMYLPVKHQGGGNLDRNIVVRYLKKQLSRPKQKKVFANSMYDTGWLKSDMDVDVAGPWLDVQVAEPLIDENQRSYSLERISKQYLGEGKDEDMLQRALSAFFTKGEAHKGNLWRLHSKYVGRYAAGDTRQTLAVFMLQMEEIRRQGLERVFDLETRLIPMLYYMRRLGVPVNIRQAEQTLWELQKKELEIQSQLNNLVSLKVNVWAANSLQAAYDQAGISYPRLPPTKDGAEGNASFTKEWLAEQTDDVSKLVAEVRKVNRMWSVFVKGQVLDEHINGRVHCQFNALRSDEGGAVTGRFSSSNPNLQQVPSPDRDPILAKFARSLFVPEEGWVWHCNDYKSIEPRVQLHYALLRDVPGAREALKLTLEGFDFHDMTAELTGLPRKQAKVINLARSYGAGPAKIAIQMGCSENEAREILRQYDAKMPWLKAIINEATERANEKGFITTLMGRRRRFELWEPGGYGRKGAPLPSRQEAIEAYGLPVQRSKTYTAFNGLAQGGSADIIKACMVEIFECGVLDAGAKLHLTMHDELDFSIDPAREDTACEIIHIMEHHVPLRVPLLVDNERGPSWGEVTK